MLLHELPQHELHQVKFSYTHSIPIACLLYTNFIFDSFLLHDFSVIYYLFADAYVSEIEKIFSAIFTD